MARRSDGQVIQLSCLLYLVAALLDGARPAGEVAERVTERFGRQVIADNVTYLIDTKLRPLGLVASTTDRSLETLTHLAPLLALRYRTRVVPPRFHRAVTSALRPLFRFPVVLFTLVGLVVVNVWVIVGYDRAFTPTLRHVLVHPGLFLLVTGLIIRSGVSTKPVMPPPPGTGVPHLGSWASASTSSGPATTPTSPTPTAPTVEGSSAATWAVSTSTPS